MRNFCLLLAGLTVAFASPVLAQPSAVDVPAKEQWKHKATGVKFPPALAGLKRDRITAYVANELDVSANYTTTDGSDQLTIFLYRNVSGNTPLWFDRASRILQLLPDKYTNPRSLGIRPFTPRGQSIASGLMETFAVEGPSRSTAVIVFPINGFYAKVRATSETRDAGSLEQLLLSAANSLDWSSRQQEVAAKVIHDCADPLPEREPANVVETNSDDRMIPALIGGVVAQTGPVQSRAEATEYCREPGRSQIAYGIYRPGGASERYLMALLDAGRAIAVGSLELAQILSELNTSPRVSVTLIELDRTATFGGFESLPLPEQAVAMVESSSPLSVASTWGRDRQISITTED